MVVFYVLALPCFTKTRLFVWLELRSPLLLPFESKSQLLSPHKKAFTLFTSKTATPNRLTANPLIVNSLIH